MKLFLVDAVSSFRNSYIVRCKTESDAADTVTMNEAEEFSQEWLGESISRIREIHEDDFLALFDKDNSYLKSWNNEQKKALIHTVEYDDTKPKPYDPMKDGKSNL
jgi:glutamine synthetase